VIVCSCTGVTHRTVQATVAAGAASCEDVGRLCGAGTGCGGCWETIRELLADRPRDDHAAAS
jgi:bacterioferritin-associated ferredoxin